MTDNPVVLPAGETGPDGSVFPFPVYADAYDLLFDRPPPAPRPGDRPADPRDRETVLAYWQARGITPPWAGADLSPVEKLVRRVAASESRIERLERVVEMLASQGVAA